MGGAAPTLTRQRAEAILARLLPLLGPELLEPARRRALPAGAHPLTGHCAVATEALFFAAGGKASGATPMSIQHEGGSHWFLRLADGSYVDPTEAQFSTPVPHAAGRGRGFPTPRQGNAEQPPSKRAAELLRRAGF